MSYGWTCFSGVHVFQDDMSYGAYILRKVMLCRRKCLVGGHEDTLDEERFYWRECLIGSHILHDGMSYRRTCLAGVHAI